MRSETQQRLEHLENIEWFTQVGQPIADTNVARVETWAAAIKSCRSSTWENVQLEEANLFREHLIRTNVQRFNLWNDVVRPLRPQVIELVDAKVAKLKERQSIELPKYAVDDIFSSVLHVIIGCEFADIARNPFWEQLAAWFEAGHFPCGWKGRHPKGMLIVF